MKILFLAANPVDVVTRLRIDEEVREIDHKIQMAGNGDQLELVSAWAVRVSDLQAALLRHKPDIVHFSGHCSPSNGIILVDKDGNRNVVGKDALADLFRILKDNVRVVVLNACYAKDQAQALTSSIDFTIGMNASIDDKSAIVFAAHFYQSLGFGRSVEEAFALAVNELRLEGLDAADVPELLVRDGAGPAQPRTAEIPRGGAVAQNGVQPKVISEDNARETPGEPARRGVAFEESNEKKPGAIAFLPWLFACSAISLTTDVLRRFLSDGWPDLAALIVQTVFVALAIGAAALTVISMMRPANSRVLRAVPQGDLLSPRKVRSAIILTGIALVIALALWLSLPVFARYYNEKGAAFQYREQPDLTLAREAYQRAVRLRPGFAQAHYNLAAVQEDLLPEKAIEEYRLAIDYDGHIYPAYNNLARLYLRRGKDQDNERALSLLDEAVGLSPSDDDVQYSLNKNLGWANYALKHYAMAESYLRRAVALRGQERGASAHCLLAYVLREQGKPGVADECFSCVTLAPGEKDVEARWVSDAQECLREGSGK